MPDHTKSAQSNADRGLERHVDPDNPAGPMLKHPVDPSKRQKPSNSEPKRKPPASRRFPKGQKPMHAVEVAREMEIPEVVVPPLPGVFSAYGILLSDFRLDYGRSVLRPLEGSEETVEAAFAELERKAEEELSTSGMPETALMLRSLDLRYAGQSYEINVPYGENLRARFHRSHEARFGYASGDESLEVVNVRLAAVVRRDRPGPKLPEGKGGSEGSREVLFAGSRTPTPVLNGRPPPGTKRDGPLIVEEETATIVVDPGTSVSVDEQGCLRIRVS